MECTFGLWKRILNLIFRLELTKPKVICFGIEICHINFCSDELTSNYDRSSIVNLGPLNPTQMSDLYTFKVTYLNIPTFVNLTMVNPVSYGILILFI